MSDNPPLSVMILAGLVTLGPMIALAGYIVYSEWDNRLWHLSDMCQSEGGNRMEWNIEGRAYCVHKNESGTMYYYALDAGDGLYIQDNYGPPNFWVPNGGERG